MVKSFVLSTEGLSLSDFAELVIIDTNEGFELSISQDVKDNVVKSRKIIEKILTEKRVVYGVNTGFGQLVSESIEDSDLEKLQKNLILSHSVGLGENLDKRIVRGSLLLLINSLSKGKSGIRLETLQILIKLFNSRITPSIPSMGSLGASGDLAQLAHIILILLGCGEAETISGDIIPGKEVLRQLNIPPLVLKAKEGLALINGTHFMTSSLLLSIFNSVKLIQLADINVALCIEALEGNLDAFSEKLLQNRPYKGQIDTGSLIRFLLKDSEAVKVSKTIQDAYSIRCAPQVHGAIRDTLSYAIKQITIEINSVSDNPIILDDETILSGGLFHGEPLGFLADFLSIALSELGTISERRINQLLDPGINKGLPPFLISSSGINSGMMIIQYSVASIVSKNKHLANPSTTDNISVSANQEDHVSLGFHATSKLFEITENIFQILSAELFCLSQALRFKDRKRVSSKVNLILEPLFNLIPYIKEDRELLIDLNNLKGFINSKNYENMLQKVFEDYKDDNSLLIFEKKEG